MFWTILLGALATFSVVSTVWQWTAARRFPLHRRVSGSGFSPAVTILKPLKGANEHSPDSLRSWLTQDYTGKVQVLFGVTSESDAACAVVRRLIVEHPGRDLQLIVCAQELGANAKVSKLIQLERLATHDVIVVSDADVRVPPDFLANAVASLRDEQVGLVNSFYRLANPVNLAMRWEAVATNADSWSQVLQGMTLAPLDFALGAVMVTRRENLIAIGGLDELADYLADDFQLGNRIARNGRKIAVCPVVVECWDAPMRWREVWTHQVRWQRTIRVCKPLPYALSLLANPLLWPVVWAAAFPSELSLGLLIASQIVRFVSAADLLRRMSGTTGAWRWCWLVPFKDALQVALWLAAFAGNRIHWRGADYRLLKDGRLRPL